MGVVYRALDEQLQIEVALKTVRPEWARDPKVLERFKGELLLARQVTHRNVVRIHDIDEHEGTLFITMDYVPGRSLRQVLQQEGPLEMVRALALFRQLAAGVQEAHHKGVLHRDLKPGNVLVDGQDRAFITDFGVARSLGTTGVTRAGAVVGTPDYLSPEQARGEPVDERSDVFALGILLFEMLSGELPFPGGTYSEILAQRISGRPRSLKDLGIEVPRQVHAVLSGCLETSLKRRFRNAEAILEALERPRSSFWTRRVATVLLLSAVGILGSWAIFRTLPVKGLASLHLGRLAASEKRITLAILPFVDESGRPELAWMASGMPELLANSLRETPTLGLTDTARVFRTLDDLQLQPAKLDGQGLKQLGELLSADRMVLGRIRTFEGRLVVDLELTTPGLGGAAADSIHLDARSTEELPDLVRRMAQQIRTRLEMNAPVKSAEPGKVSAAALQDYSAGVEFLRRGDSLQATPLLEKAVAEAPAFNAAWLRLTESYQDQGQDEKALEAARQAVATLGSHPGPIVYLIRAREALLRGEPTSAEKVLREMARDYPNDLEGRMLLAHTMAEQGKPSAAAEVLGTIVKVDPNHPRAWFLLGKYSIQAGDPRRAAEDHLIRALIIQTQLHNRQGQGEVLNASGVAYQELGQLDLALENYQKAAELRLAVGDVRGRAISLKNIATVHMIRGDLARSQANLAAALKLLEGLGDKAGMAELLNAFGGLEEERGSYAEALSHYRNALQIWRAIGDQRSLARSYNNVGYAYYLLSDYENAMVYFQQASQLYRTTGDKKGSMLVSQSIGLVQLAQGPWEGAVKSFLESLNQGREEESKNAQAVSHGYLGVAAQYQGRYAAALASFDKALKSLEQLKDPRGLAEFTFHRAATLSEIGMQDEAESALAKVERILAAGMNSEQKSTFHTLRGEMRLARRALPEAKAAFAEAVKEAVASHGLDRVLRARLGLACATVASGDPTGGLKQLRPLLAEAQRIGHLCIRLRILEAMGQAERERGDFNAAESRLREATRLLQTAGAYAGAFRIHLGLAELQERRGNAGEAKASYARAKALCAAIRSDLSPLQRAAFDRIPEVRRLE